MRLNFFISASLFFAACISFSAPIDGDCASVEPPASENLQVDSPLISVSDLKERLGQENLVILDLGPEKELYDKGHIAGAQFVNWVDDITDLRRSELYRLADKEKFQSLLRKLGVTNNSKIVVYDDMNSRVSVRMYWSLKYYGVDNVQVLNGGRPAWAAANYPLTSESKPVEPSSFVISNVQSDLSVDLDFVADRLQNPNVSLIDGRPVDQFSGKIPGKVFHTGSPHDRNGHVPGATNIFWKDNFNADGTFKSIDELKELYKSVTGSDTIVTYCNEGLHAAPPWFVLSQLLGHGNVRLYDNSMAEWTKTKQPLKIEDKVDDNNSKNNKGK